MDSFERKSLSSNNYLNNYANQYEEEDSIVYDEDYIRVFMIKKMRN